MFGSKKIKKQIAFLQYTVEELKKTIETQELQKLRFVAEQNKKEREDLTHLRIKLKDIKEVLCEDGFPRIEVRYEIPTLYLDINEDGTTKRNETFRSINNLNVLSQEDTLRIAKVLDETKQKYKKV